MKYRFISTALLLISTLANGQSTPASDPSDVEAQLRRALEGKVFSLRMPTLSTKLDFDSKGQPTTTPAEAPWTTGGLLRVKKARMRSETLHIEGERILVALRSGKSPPDLMLVSTGRSVLIVIHLDGPSVNAREVSAILPNIFEGTNIKERIAKCWEPSPPSLPAGDVVGTLEGARAVYGGVPGIIPPRAIYAPDPEYTNSARNKRLQGEALLMVVINEKGLPEILKLVQDLGEGLDVKSLVAVSSWRFKPAIRNNTPVAVMVNVKLTFRLY